ncbi:MAG: amidohydrolase family protein [Proteobacteria bacterium]|nr:amidohydrolase family protein [Pseudomonadota bacterium]
MMYGLLATGTLALSGAPGCAIQKKHVPDYDQDTPFILTHVNVVDVISGQVTPDAHVIIDSIGKIISMGQGPVELSPGHRVIDMKGRYLTPGLIDAHCHSTVSPVFAMRMADLVKHARQQKMNYVNTINSGVTTIRDMGAFTGMLRWFMRDIEKGRLPGPRVVYCNSILNVKGSHPEIPPSDVNFFARPASVFMGMMMSNFKGPDQLAYYLEENARGASFIKLTLDNKTIFCKKDPTLPVYSTKELDTIFGYAEKKGLPVVGHHHYVFGFDRAMEYPFHSIEHVVSDQYLSDAQVQRMADRKVAIVPTLTIAQSYLMEEAFDGIPAELKSDWVDDELKVRRHYFDMEAGNHCEPSLHAQNLAMLDNYKRYKQSSLFEHKKFLVNPELYFGMVNKGFANLKKMKDAGVLIGCGIDAGMPLNYFGGLYREFEIFQRLGFTSLEILQCATINNAKILKMDDSIGSLDPGKWADMVAFDDNPLRDVQVLRNPAMVFKQGQLMYSSRDLSGESAFSS